MAAAIGRPNHPLIRVLLDEAPRFSFFQAVRLLQALHPDSARVGYQGPPQDECIRFTSALDLAFPSADIAQVREEEPLSDEEAASRNGQPRYNLSATFLGLYGTSSPLPASYTEDLLDQEEDCLERGFYDLFQHRALSLFYRVWERYRLEVRFRADGKDYFSRRLSCLLHTDHELLPENHSVPMLRMIALGGLLTQAPRSMATLQAALKTTFPRAEVGLEGFRPRWLPIPEEQWCHLGTMNSRLGEDAHMGREILDRACTFRLDVEPTGFPQYRSFLPGGDYLTRLRELVDLFNSDYLDYEVEVRIREEDVPELRLGAPSALLGWSTWLGHPSEPERHVLLLFRGAIHG